MSVTVDTVAPITPTISLQSVDSNIVGDRITNVNVISLTGTAETNSTIKVYDGSTLLGSATANAEGVWNFVADLSDDQISAPASTATITETAWSSKGSVYLAGTADPNSTVSIFDSANGALLGSAITGSDGQWNFVQTVTTARTFAVTQVIPARDSTTGDESAALSEDQAWGFTTGALADGVHNFTAVSTDLAGNVSATSTVLSVTIDTAAPVTPTITAYSTDSGTAGDGITNDNTLTLTGSAEANATVKVYDGATLLGIRHRRWQRQLVLYDGRAHQRRPQPERHRHRCRRQYQRGLERRSASPSIPAAPVSPGDCLVLDRQRHGWRWHHQ